MRDGETFRKTIRGGAKSVQPDLVIHLSDASTPTEITSVGFVVSKAVGNAVVRNRVKRQLRHAVLVPLRDIPVGHSAVVRAFETASGADSDRLRDEVVNGFAHALEKLAR